MKIILIVDNPLRDLPAQVLVALSILKKNRNAKVFLTPWNPIARNRGAEIWNISPDYILFNYLRANNEVLIKKVQDIGIKTGVLDTEGGVLVNLESYTKTIAKNKLTRESINHYFSWGTTLAKFLEEQKLLLKETIHITGSPRFDFYTSPFNHTVNSHQQQIGDYILFNGNFPIGNPQFQTVEQEIEMMVEKFGYSREEMQQWVDTTQEALDTMSKLIVSLAKKFRQLTFIYRPHPFENIQTYNKYFENQPNILLKQEGTVDQWILGAKAVIQRSCSTAIESSISKIPTFSPKFVPVHIEQPVAEVVSDPCASEEELVDKITSLLADEYVVPEQTNISLNKVIPEWFFKIDGNAHQRIASIIANTPPPNNQDKVKQKVQQQLQKIALIERIKRSIRSLPFKTASKKLGPPIQDMIWWDKSKKYYGVKEVQKIVAAITKVKPEFSNMVISLVENESPIKGDYYRSIQLTQRVNNK